MEEIVTLKTTDTDTTNLFGKPYNVILFNDQEHDQLEVTLQIIKATNCSPALAAKVMLEAHNTGRAIVFSGGLERCEHVEAILSEIRLSTKIEAV